MCNKEPFRREYLMKIAVCLNRVRYVPDPDHYDLIIKRKPDPVSMNNEEKYLVETALRLIEGDSQESFRAKDSDRMKDSHRVKDSHQMKKSFQIRESRQTKHSVLIVAAGGRDDAIMVREGLAMGCQSGYLISCQDGCQRENNIALEMAGILRKEQCDMVITGERMMDGAHNFLGPQLGCMLGLPILPALLEVNRAGHILSGKRRSNRKDYEVSCDSPCLVTLVNHKAEDQPLSVMKIQEAFEKDLHIIRPSKKESFCYGKMALSGLSKPIGKKTCKMYGEITVEEAADAMIRELQEQGLGRDGFL